MNKDQINEQHSDNDEQVPTEVDIDNQEDIDDDEEESIIKTEDDEND